LLHIGSKTLDGRYRVGKTLRDIVNDDAVVTGINALVIGHRVIELTVPL
jgi:hypothetical protein